MYIYKIFKIHVIYNLIYRPFPLNSIIDYLQCKSIIREKF